MPKRRFVLFAAVMFCCLSSVTFTASFLNSDLLPRLELSDLQYLGGFRLPAHSVNGDNYQGGGLAVAFNPNGNSLFVSSYYGNVAEVTIPTPVNSSDPAAMPFASFLQPFADPTEGHVNDATFGYGGGISSLLVSGNRLYGTAAIYYDANHEQRVSHYSRALQLNQQSFLGWSQVWESGKAGYVSGFMAAVPSEWQSLLGGPVLTGQCCIPIVSRTSFGPSAFAFNPALISPGAAVPATPLLYYDGAHQTLGEWANITRPNETYNQSTEIHGLAVIAGTRTVLYVGRNGLGIPCYGNGTSIQSLAGTYGPDGALYCYDLAQAGKGTHAYPYRYQIWAYDLNDLAAVKAGNKQPWEVVPYAVWPLTLPTPEKDVRLGGVGYDAERQVLYVSQFFADRDGLANRPIIHAFRINANGAAPPALNTVRAVSLSADRTAPQTTATPITFVATPAGGVAPHQYKWSVFDGRTWSVASDWSAAYRFTWTPATPSPDYRIGVSVRSAGNAQDAAEASISTAFPIDAKAADEGGAVAVSKVTLSTNKAAPQAAGVTITWSAASSGGSGSLLHKWWISDGVSWTAASGWTPTPTYEWTPAVAGSYRVAVWVKRASNSSDQAEAAADLPFAITAAGTTAPVVPPSSTPTPTESSRVSHVTLKADRLSPQPPMTTITWTAQAFAGAAPYEYQWWQFDGARWTILRGWGVANTFSWSPAVANAQYQIGVWARSSGSTSERGDATISQAFAIKTSP